MRIAMSFLTSGVAVFVGGVCLLVSIDAVHGNDMYFSVPASICTGLITISSICLTVGLLTGRIGTCER